MTSKEIQSPHPNEVRKTIKNLSKKVSNIEEKSASILLRFWKKTFN
jgi:hypothetical protein